MISYHKTKEDIISIYDRHKSTVYRAAFSLVKNKDDADDIVQMTFIKLLEADKVFENDEHVKAWLIKTCTNLSKNHLIHWSRKNCSVDTISDSFLISRIVPPDIDVKDAILFLPAKYRVVIYLYYYKGYNSREIAVILDKKPSTIRSRLKVAIKLLKKDLER